MKLPSLNEIAKELGYIDLEHARINLEDNPDYSIFWNVLKKYFKKEEN